MNTGLLYMLSFQIVNEDVPFSSMPRSILKQRESDDRGQPVDAGRSSNEPPTSAHPHQRIIKSMDDKVGVGWVLSF